MAQAIELFFRRGDNFGVAMAKNVAGDSGGEIKVFFPLVIIDVAPPCLGNGKAGVISGQDGRKDFFPSIFKLIHSI